jgi:pimeloyl-ACP methyl ester carboxylesterase
MKRFSSIVAGIFFLISGATQAGLIDRAYLDWKQKKETAQTSSYEQIAKFATAIWKNPLATKFAVSGAFEQKLDHFDSANEHTFPQRFWVDSSNAASSPVAPVLYFICGESRCSGASGFVNTLAKEIGAHVVTLEHRYYGDSIPTASYSAKNLRFLSTDQALADLAAFQNFAVKEWGMKGPWIAIGGSYSASLAAYYRYGYPDQVVGALASSAPVEARADFEEYDYQVATGVSRECLSRIQLATNRVESSLRDEASAKAVKNLFGSAEIQDERDFLYVVADMAAASIQYGERENFCHALESASDSQLVAEYARVGLSMFERLDIRPIDDTAQGNLSEDVRNYTASGMRQWFYQSCTEFGYWQIAYHDPALSARSPKIDLAFHDGICERMFGIRRPVDTTYINRTFYKPLVRGKATQIFFTNGSDDPWKHLSLVPARGNVPNEVNAMEIPGAAHCDDLSTQGTVEVRKAQNRFRSLVKDWLD